MKIYFCTFGSGNTYAASLDRITQQARSMNIFTDIFVYNENKLRTHTEFWKQNGDFIESNPRGYGYWIWKPFIIHHIMRTVMTDGDILLYCDCGSTLKNSGSSRLFQYFTHAMNAANGILGFELSYPEKKYTKMDILVALDATHLADTNQIMATDIIVCKNARSMDIIDKWYNTCTTHHLIDDSPSIFPNSDIFVENRHDQSIFSVVLKLCGGATLLGEETEKNEPQYPIWNSRIRS